MDIHKIDRSATPPLRILKTSAFSLLLSTFFLSLSIAQAPAQTWPTRPVSVIVPFTAGTTSDVLARGVTEYLASALGQPFPIDNRGGAGGNIAGGVAAKARPDGYTLLFATTGPAATNKLMYKDLTFDPQRDFTPIILVGKSPVIIVARPDAPFGSLKELIDYARANPNKLTAGFPGNGTLGHITGELLQVRSGIKFSHTQYRGSPQIMTDLIGGHIDIGMDSMAAYVSNVQEGKIKALAVAGSKRWSELPNVPTASESGLPDFEASVWYVLLARTGTPPEIIRKLNGAVTDYLKSEQAKKFFESLGLEFGGGTPEDAKQFIAAEVDKWAPVIKAANISF
jgi:tripartite-type tricarboxylate transporter receptor subunit TctC